MNSHNTCEWGPADSDTRMQSIEARSLYKNSFQCAAKIFKEEGILTFWSGAVPRLGRLILSGGIVFTMSVPCCPFRIPSLTLVQVRKIDGVHGQTRPPWTLHIKLVSCVILYIRARSESSVSADRRMLISHTCTVFPRSTGRAG